jgi:TetR/AcrR family transcriptional regulator, transcriptional repressor for nem operon
MVRTRSYDEAEVLSGAMHAFRRAGYAGLSIPELEAATGLSSGSIYNSFGDKRGIFLASFEHYLQAVLGRRIAQFAGPETGLSGLRQLFLTLLLEPNGETFGCLITNSAIEFGAERDIAAGAVARGFEVLERLFIERLSAAKSAGSLPSGFNVRSGAVRLLALYQGILVLVRGGFDLRRIKAAIHQEFDHLEGKSA